MVVMSRLLVSFGSGFVGGPVSFGFWLVLR